MMLILTFLSAHHALAAESVLRQRQVRYELLPTPRAITSHCGLSLRLETSDYWGVQALLEEAGVSIAAVYIQEGEHGNYSEVSAKE